MQGVKIESDCQEAVNLIQNGAHPNCPYRALVEDTKFVTQNVMQIGVDQQEVLEIYENPPSSIRPFLVADLVGLVYERD